jgi:nitrogen regulatory protein PII
MTTPVKKIEIIVDYLDLQKVVSSLRDLGIKGYTVIREASGTGDRGARAGDGLSGEFNNSLILIACSESECTRIIESMRPLLKRFGGVCLVSDAQWVIH